MQRYKKWIYYLLFAGLIFLTYYVSNPSSEYWDSGYCPFCDSQVLNNQKFYEDEWVIGLYTHKPATPGHSLAIPKRHVERFDLLTDQEMLALTQLLRKIHYANCKICEASSYLILQKNGIEVGQSVPHLHFHYIPRKKEEHSLLTFWMHYFWSLLKSPISSIEMQSRVEKFKEKFQESN